MPEALDTVTIALNRGNITIPWDARQALLSRLQRVKENLHIRATFDAVGASRPVELKSGQKAALLKTLEDWWGERSGMPIELAALHDALKDDLHDASEPQASQ